MTMPNKNRRTICVDGDTYYWKERVEQTGKLTIQHASGGSCIIVLPLDIMLPANVADGIRFAIQAGWLPGKPGANLWLGFQDLDPKFRQLAAHSSLQYNREKRFFELPSAVDSTTTEVDLIADSLW